MLHQLYDPSWSALTPPTSSPSRPPPSVRILLFTDPSGRNGASSRGTRQPKQRRLVFDSKSVRRDEGIATADGKDKYDEVVGGVGYKYLHPRRPDTEHLSEMVFGTIDLSEKSSGYKVHPIDEENTLWSKLFYARKDDVMAAGSRKAALGSNFSASDHSFTMSSHGSNISAEFGSLQSTGTSSSPSLDHFLHPPHHPPPAAQQNVVIPIVGFADSGIYLVPSVNNVASNNASNGSSSSGSADHWLPHQSASGNRLPPPLVRTPEDSELQTAPVGGAARFHIGELRPERNSSTSGSDTHLQPPPSSPCPTRRASSSSSSSSSQRLMGLAMLISATEDDTRTFFERSVFVEDVMNRLKARCINAFFGSEKFLHHMHRAWKEAESDLAGFFTLSRLRETAWIAVSKAEEGRSAAAGEAFLKEFLAVRHMLDRKDNQLFFSTFLSAFLSCHLGWATCVANDFCNMGSPPSPWDWEEKRQYYQLHGMIGNPCKPFKSILVGEDAHILRRFVHVLSYFLRCKVSEKRKVLTFPPYELLSSKKVPVLTAKETKLTPPVVSVSLERDTEEDDEVSFTIGDHESLVSAERLERRRTSRTVAAAEKPASEEDKENLCDVLLEFPRSKVSEVTVDHLTDSLPTVICVSDRLVPGSVLQGCCVKRCEMSEFRQNIELDLRTSMENSWVSSAGCSHYLGLVGDCDSGAVHIHSTFGSNRKDATVPFYPVPLVLDLIDVVDGIASISAKAVKENVLYVDTSPYGKTTESPSFFTQAMQLLESKLSDIVNRSVVLAKYLMSEDFVSKEKLVKDLGWHFNDVELLLPLSSIHTPAVGEKYGIGFF